MWIQTLLLGVAACYLIPQDAGPSPINGIWLELHNLGNEISELQVVLYSDRLIYLDPGWPKIKLLANHDPCGGNWRWPISDSLPVEEPASHLIRDGDLLAMPAYQEITRDDYEYIDIEFIAGMEVEEGQNTYGITRDLDPERQAPCFYRFELRYALEPWLPDEEPESVYLAFSKGFTVECLF
jgi:hypothetical protein